MNWPRIIIIISLIGLAVAIFGATVLNFLMEIDWTILTDPLLVIGTIVGAITTIFDSTILLYPFTFSLITITMALGIAKFVFIKVFKK